MWNKLIYGLEETLCGSGEGTWLPKIREKCWNVDIDGSNISAQNSTFILIACCATIHLSSTEAEVTVYIQLSNIHTEPNNQGTLAIDEGTLHIKLWKRHWGGAINLSQQLRKELGKCGEVLWSYLKWQGAKLLCGHALWINQSISARKPGVKEWVLHKCKNS